MCCVAVWCRVRVAVSQQSCNENVFMCCDIVCSHVLCYSVFSIVCSLHIYIKRERERENVLVCCVAVCSQQSVCCREREKEREGGTERKRAKENECSHDLFCSVFSTICSLYIYVYKYIYVHIHVYIHILSERERDCSHVLCCSVCVLLQCVCFVAVYVLCCSACALLQCMCFVAVYVFCCSVCALLQCMCFVAVYVLCCSVCALLQCVLNNVFALYIEREKENKFFSQQSVRNSVYYILLHSCVSKVCLLFIVRTQS